MLAIHMDKLLTPIDGPEPTPEMITAGVMAAQARTGLSLVGPDIVKAIWMEMSRLDPNRQTT